MDDQPQLDPEQKALHDQACPGRHAAHAEPISGSLETGAGHEAHLAELRAAVQRGIDDIKAGRVVDLEDGLARIEAMLDELEAARRT